MATSNVITRLELRDPYANKLAQWFETAVARSRKQRRALRQIHTRF